MIQPLAPLIAVVGADGSGKSTLLPHLVAHIAATRPAEAAYLGLGSGPLGERIRRWPLIGPPLARLLMERAARARDPDGTIPDLMTAFVIYRFSVKRWKRFQRIMARRAQGIAVVTDRYPQIEVPGFYDGPGLSAARTTGRAMAWLAARERRLYERMIVHPPTLVLRLNIDAETALARKPEHERALVERKVAATPRLGFNGAPVAEIDAARPFDRVLREAIAAVDHALAPRR